MNIFFTSLASGLGIPGANAEKIMPYIPAIVVTLYDGYYIYSPSETIYTGGALDINTNIVNETEKTGYTHLLKPYIYYSAKYVNGNDYAVVNYSLDSYIAIYGRVDGKVISNSGYLYSNKFDNIYQEEILRENIKYIDDDKIIKTKYNCEYVYSNLSNKDNSAQKVYNINGKWCILNGLNKVPVDITNTVDNSAKKYVEESKKFTNWIMGNERLKNLVTPANARYQTVDDMRKLD